MSPPATGLTGPFNQTYLSGLQTTVSYITGKGAYVLLDRKLYHPCLPNFGLILFWTAHNFMRYNNAIITSVSE